MTLEESASHGSVMKRMLTMTWALARTTSSPASASAASLPQRLAVLGETTAY
jgi:hypothetical protein